MFQKNERGFTLVELLVTVGIIGILATITVASLSGTRTRARDAQRISDIKQLVSILDAEFAANPGGDEAGEALAGCDGSTAALKLTTACTGPGTSIPEAFAKFKDPQTPATACANAGAASCGYSISTSTGAAGAKTGNYQVCFFLENANSGTYVKGMNNIKSKTNGQPTAGCT